MNLEHFYGPSAPNNFISWIVNKCKNDESIPLTEGKHRRDFIHVYDVCSAFNAVLNHIGTLDSFVEIDVGTGISTSVRAVVELIKKNSNSNSKLLFGEVSLGNNQVSEMCANTKKLKSLGWKPKYSLEKGLMQLL
jgi:nucleoside-diphosphate-sugar epimerase